MIVKKNADVNFPEAKWLKVVHLATQSQRTSEGSYNVRAGEILEPSLFLFHLRKLRPSEGQVLLKITQQILASHLVNGL